VWDGSSWSVQPTPNPMGGSNSELVGVSCTSSSACTAVGNSSSGTLAEVWDGSSWSIQPTPNPAGASLAGVSGTSARACTGGGNTVTITGTSFEPGATVKFGTNASASVTYVSSTELQAVVPAAASTGNVHVTVTESGVTSPLSDADLYAYTAISVANAAPVN